MLRENDFKYFNKETFLVLIDENKVKQQGSESLRMIIEEIF